MIEQAILWGILGGLASIVAILTFLKKPLDSLIDKIRREQYNHKICKPITKLGAEFLKEEYNFDQLKPIKIEKNETLVQETRQHEDFTAILLSPRYYRDSKKNLDLTTLSLVIEWGVEKPIRDALVEKGFGFEDADVIAKEGTKKFVEHKVPELKIKRSSIETLKTKITTSEGLTKRREFLKRNYEKIRGVIKNRPNNTNLKQEYDKILVRIPEYKELIKDDVNELIKERVLKTDIKEDSGIDLSGKKDIKFTKATQDSLYELKTSFLDSRQKFLARVKKIGNRSEQIYALILEYPGRYEVQMSTDFEIPQPTISLYATAMAADNFIIKDNYTTSGNYVFLYPLFTFQEMTNNSNLLSNYELAIVGKLIENQHNLILENYSGLKLDFSAIGSTMSNCVGSKVLVKGKLTSKDIFKISTFGIVEPKSKQLPLFSFFNK